jgi:tRNA pseudouridine38-40 synthase
MGLVPGVTQYRFVNDMADEVSSRRFALLLEYDGGRYAGSQLQATLPTVQSVLEDALLKATGGDAIRVAYAGRTDAGVHALGQVGSFVSATRLDAETLTRALNAWLPADVVVRCTAQVGDDFDPRRQAVRRRYRYVIDNGPTRSALQRDRAWHVGQTLDVDAMARAAQGVLGVHDFKAFASPLEDPSASTVRELMAFEVRRDGLTVTCELVANAFLPHQVRRMVGALTEVGRGKLTPAQYAAMLDNAAASAGPTAPPHGLYLVQVEYPEAVFP